MLHRVRWRSSSGGRSSGSLPSVTNVARPAIFDRAPRELECTSPARRRRQDVGEAARAVGEVVAARHLAGVPRDADVVRPDVRVRAVGREVLVVEGARPPVVHLWPVVAAVHDVVAVQRLRTHHVAHGERPSRLAREEPEPAAFEVALHGLGEAVVVVAEGAAVGPHELERAGLVERGGAGGRLDAVDDIAEERREHDVVVRIGSGFGSKLPIRLSACQYFQTRRSVCLRTIVSSACVIWAGAWVRWFAAYSDIAQVSPLSW